MKMNDVAKRIQALLDERGEKLKPVCDRAGVKYYSVYPWWSRPNASADADNVRKLARYFGVPLGHLQFGDTINPNKSPKEELKDKVDSLDTSEQDQVADFLDFLALQRAKKERGQ